MKGSAVYLKERANEFRAWAEMAQHKADRYAGRPEERARYLRATRRAKELREQADEFERGAYIVSMVETGVTIRSIHDHEAFMRTVDKDKPA